MKILFWGTPAFAIPSLRALLGEGHDVAGVVTQPDRPAGRGRALQMPPVKRLAVEEMLPVLQPAKPAGADFVSAVRGIAPDLFVVVAYGQILRREVLELPPLGAINLHSSLLPALRGAAPIQWAIANGETRTGVTIMRMNERMDAGPIILQVAEPIGNDETGANLTARLSEIGAEALIEALALLEAGVATERAQDDTLATFAPRIEREDARIEWTREADVVARRIRAFDDVPGAWSTLDGAVLKVFRPLPEPSAAPVIEPPGTVLEASTTNAERALRVACGTGSVWIREVQPSGRRRMLASEWLRGRSLHVDACLV